MNATRSSLFALCLGASSAQASYHTFALDEIYSNADGTVQYVVLREASGADGQNLLSGHALTANYGSASRTFAFTHDLASVATAGRRVLLATPGFAALSLVTPDYLMPARFVATDGGMLDYAGVDQWTYGALPTDGTSALFRSGGVGSNLAINFAGQSASAPALPITVVEYYHAALDHYFISGLAPDIDALDSGRFTGWTRTGQVFNAFPTAASGGAAASPVCRFIIPPQHGDSHFFSASPAECDAILQKIGTDPNYSGYVYESPNVFYLALPDTATGVCPPGTATVYRLWNGRVDSNHRYTGDPVTKATMVAMGYIAEGYGPDSASMCATVAPAASSEFRASDLSPFTFGCDLVAANGTLYANAEVEPSIAIDPRNANHLIGAWQQDRWSSGGARGNLSAASFDGGVTWTRRAAPFSRCTGGNAANGGDYARTSDPWVTIAPDGAAYQIAIAFNGGTFQAGSANAVLASRSDDGGLTWGNAVTLMRDGGNFFNDKESITADPTDARYVYAVWDRLAPSGNGPSYLSRTTNGGINWDTARAIYDPGGNSQTINNLVVVLTDGTLVDFFTQLDEVAGDVRATLRLIRSNDKGATWSPPVTVAIAQSLGTHDPDTSTPIRDASNLGSIAAGPNGELAAVWQDSRFSGGAIDGIALSRSLDGGLTWSLPVQVNHDPRAQAFVPSVAFLADGTIGVTYYDLRGNTTSTSTLPTDYWLSASRDGATWRESHVAGPFNLAIAPTGAVSEAGTGNGLFLGDYQALASNGSVFIPFYAHTNNDLNNRSDVFATVAGTSLSMLASAADGTATTAEPAGRTRAPVAPLAMTPELTRRLSDSIVRAMQRRIPGWTMRGVSRDHERVD